MQGCTKAEVHISENENIELVAKKLAIDKEFNVFIDNLNLFSSFINDNFDKNEMQDLKSKIESIRIANLKIDDQYNEILKATKFKNKKDLVNIFEKISSSHSNLFTNKIHGTLTKEIFERAVILKQKSELVNNQYLETRGVGGYLLCSAAVSFEGALLLAACEVVTGGVGTPFCIAGASLWAADGIANCRKEHLE